MGVELIFLLKIGKYIHITIDTKKMIIKYRGLVRYSYFVTIVDGMSAEKKKNTSFLLDFNKGSTFRGTLESCEHLPFAQTCLYLLRVSPYFNRVMMQTRPNMITQEHIGWLQHW
uniref:Uncharacterized protein n=1 Tax=Solanum lycopersicum TaxID=4081 RepID=A0A3Q7I2B2_SOLLC